MYRNVVRCKYTGFAEQIQTTWAKMYLNLSGISWAVLSGYLEILAEPRIQDGFTFLSEKAYAREIPDT